ncbi:TPA: hypothetical protein ACKPZN_003841 [Pseudomonas aeruginosa]|nr:hypothetical protein [Pseudomonas aeruginosa]
MSEVERFNEYTWGVTEDEHGEYVRYADYDALAAKLAMAEDAAAKGDAARQQCGGMEMEIEELRAELAELRARVVVVPDDLLQRCREILEWQETGILKGDALRSYCQSKIWGRDPSALRMGEGETAQEAYRFIDELARLNGLTVSEGLVQGMAKFAREIICGALDGGSFDGADIQESAERHGLIAKQVMNEPCRGPEEYCACAWSTSFPAECYRVTPKLRALLDAGKEDDRDEA